MLTPKVIRSLELPIVPEERESQQEDDIRTATQNNLASISSLLTLLSQLSERKNKGEQKPLKFLVAKGLLTLHMRLIDSVLVVNYYACITGQLVPI